MNRDEVILIAREAGLRVAGNPDSLNAPTVIRLERFAALAAAREREAWAKVADDAAIGPDMSKLSAFGKCVARGAMQQASKFADALRARSYKGVDHG